MQSVSPTSTYANDLWDDFEARVPSERPDKDSGQEHDWGALMKEGSDALSLPKTAEETKYLEIAVEYLAGVVRQRSDKRPDGCLVRLEECKERLEEHIEALEQERFFEVWNEAVSRYENYGRNGVKQRLQDLGEDMAGYQTDYGSSVSDFELPSFEEIRKRVFVQAEAEWNYIFERATELSSDYKDKTTRASRHKSEVRFRCRVLNLLLDEDFSARGIRRIALSSDSPVSEEREQNSRGDNQEDLPISGTHGAEYAEEAKNILDDTPTITTFSELARKMEGNMANGESKVKTIKRNIGYEDLPRDEKGFTRFLRMLDEKLNQLYGED